MTFKESIVSVFKNYANIKGRASRSEFWWWMLFQTIISFCLGFIGGIFAVLFEAPNLATIITWIGTLVLICPTFCLQVRRYHDSNHSGWWVLVPIVSWILCFYRSDEGENDYGILNEQVQ